MMKYFQFVPHAHTGTSESILCMSCIFVQHMIVHSNFRSICLGNSNNKTMNLIQSRLRLPQGLLGNNSKTTPAPV